jgi:CDP-4-dehydro-6-deoxyglucose reductase, E1
MKKIKLIKSTFLNENAVKEKLANFILNTEILSMGEQCKLFEKEFSLFQGRKYSLMVNSGSSANLALIQSMINLGWLNKGDKVAFSSLTWSTNVMPIIQLGLIPIPIDIDLETLNVGSNSFDKTISSHPDIKAFFISNILGFCSDIDVIVEQCKAKNIYLIEDNCESLGSVYKDIKLGNFGIASTFSSYVGHHLSTIEGGMVCTDNEDLANMISMVRAHGWDRNLSDESKEHLKNKHNINDFYDLYTFYELAYNIRPTEISGFIGITQLSEIDESIKLRESNYTALTSAISKNSNCIQIQNSNLSIVSNFAFPIILTSKTKFLDAIDLFKHSGIEIRPVVGGNMTRQPFYDKYCGKNTIKMDNVDIVHDQGFYIPNNPDLTQEDISNMQNVIENI